MFNFAYVINPKCNRSFTQGCNNLIRITWGGLQYRFFKMVAVNFAWNRVFSFSQLCYLYWKTNIFFRNSCFLVQSVFVINVSLFTSVICYWQWIMKKMENARCATNWWPSFMNQRLNYLVLLYEKCICIRIMSLNTHSKNVDIL